MRHTVIGGLSGPIIYRVTIKEIDTFNVIKNVSVVETPFA
jgi:hypothetical protein